MLCFVYDITKKNLRLLQLYAMTKAVV